MPLLAAGEVVKHGVVMNLIQKLQKGGLSASRLLAKVFGRLPQKPLKMFIRMLPLH